jgi:thiol-disulfide isomerase/thioredoxin
MQGLSRLLLIVVLIVGAVFVVVGYSIGQIEDTRGYASVICTSCLGIQEIAPELTFQQKAELTNLQNPVELILFTSKVCLDCPKAHYYVESIEQTTEGKVSYIVIDAVQNQTLAEKYDIKYVPSVIVGDLKLEGLGQIREGLVPAILELSKGPS